MLETASLSAVRSHAIRRTTVLPISIALHALAGATALFASLWVIEFPHSPPDQLSILPLVRPVRVPEPIESRPEPARPEPRRPAPETPVPTLSAPRIAAPQVIPDEIPVLAAPGETIVEETLASSSLDSGGTSDSGASEGGGGTMGGGGSGSSDAPYRAGGDVKPPVVLQRVDPRYPAALVKLRREGVVVVECVIDRDGRIREARSLSGPHPALEESALEAVRRWRFAPGTLNGEPVDVVFVLTVNFQIN